jgi:hypothetical protein
LQVNALQFFGTAVGVRNGKPVIGSFSRQLAYTTHKRYSSKNC